MLQHLLVQHVRRIGRDRGVAVGDQLGVDHEVPDIDIGEHAPLRVFFLRIHLETHRLAEHEGAVELGRLGGAGVHAIAGHPRVARVDPDVAR